ncbi:hypothetical protein A0H81_04382 [Grifola frondosa]|uniref:Uncharacterized protein n=1 Tax=Grifola frondosa TaxID=5627 RepID=A0A1C7MFV5_GRIFR|nr:hypothetical protein A0H81_04382 [Grifola frondosa]
MASDVLVESDVIDSPLSTVTTPSDDSTSDAVNTASARVYFGPLQSPEKRYAPRAGSARSRTPLRRSARFASKSRSNVNEEAYARSQDGTPLDEILQDEPSSVLASKILRAHDNPSPPPSPLPIEREIPLPWQDSNILLDDVFESTQPEATNSPRGRVLVDLTVDQTAVSGNASRPSTITPQHVDEADSSSSDLITFDSFSSPSAFKARRHTTPARAVTEREHPIMTTVDDLLSLSPLPNLVEPRPTSPQTIPSAEGCLEDVSPSTDEEMQVLATLTSDCAPPSPPLVADTLPAIAEAASELPSILMSGPTTPVKCSTRPRRSCSPVPKIVSQTPPSTSVHDILLPPMPEIPVPDQFIALPPEESVQPDRESTEQPSNAGADVGNDIDAHTLECSEGGNSRSLAENSPSQIKSPVNDAPDTTLGSPKVKEKAGRLKRVSRAGADLGPLSPTSSNLLMQLLPQASGSGASPPVSSVQDSGNVSELKPTTPPKALPTLSSVNLEEPAIPALTIQRPPSVPPTTTPFLADASRTPARRIPISQAVAEGAFSAQKHRFMIGMGKRGIGTDVGVGLLGSPVFRRAALDDPTRSPAKRIPISEAVPVPPASPAKGKSVMRGQSPARMLFRERERSGSAEPKPLVVRKQRSASAEPPTLAVGKNGFFQRPPPSAARSHVATCSDSEVERERKWGTLPFPIIVPGRVPPAIPEAEEVDSGPSSKPLKSSPAKPVSSLRQPSAGSGSKIPRIGAKPYARPKAAEPSAMKETRMLAPTKRGAVVGAGSTASAVGPLRIVRLATGSGSSSDEGNVKATAAAAVRHKRSAACDNTAALSLKRKRDTEKPKPSPPPILVMRKVVPGMFAQAGKAASSSTVTAPVEEQAPSSPAKPQGPIKMRRVADWKRPPAVKELSRNDEVHAKQKDKIPENPPMPEPVPELDKISAPIRNTTPAASPPEAGPSSSTAAQPSIDSSPATPSGVPTESEVAPARRTTRSRRKVDSTSDVFGTIAPASVRPLQIRRKHPLPLDNGPFSGMTALALKALTTANTNRNQQHVVSLKTEVIRKEGKRPESPTSKVRTVLERQKEEKVQQRKERAERRARRGADGSGIDGMSDFDGASDLMDSSFLSVDRDTAGNPLRHRRGPGRTRIM